jgi:hypothetical protein
MMVRVLMVFRLPVGHCASTPNATAARADKTYRPYVRRSLTLCMVRTSF